MRLCSRLFALRVGAALLVGATLLVSTQVSAQYLKHPDPRIPRTADGKPNLTAPAPRLPDGKPDLQGLWNAADGRFLTNIAKRAGFDAPFQPWAAALFKERQDNEGRDRPAGRCLPHTIPTAMMVPNYPWKVGPDAGPDDHPLRELHSVPPDLHRWTRLPH
jgi:hypothetical protein